MLLCVGYCSTLKGKVNVCPIVTFTLSPLGNHRRRCSSPFQGPELAVSCRHSSVTWAVGHTFPHTAVTFPAFRPVPNCTAWRQRHVGVSNLPRVVAWWCTGRESNPQSLGHESDALTTTTPPSLPLQHTTCLDISFIGHSYQCICVFLIAVDPAVSSWL